MIQYREVLSDSIPMSLLLLADPLESKVRRYLTGANCFGAFKENELISVCVINTNINDEIELFNIASLPDF